MAELSGEWTYEVHELSEGFSAIVYDEHGQMIADYLTEDRARLIAAAPELAEAVKDVAASLVAAITILRRATDESKEPRQVVASDKMFRQMLSDYEGSLDRARAALSKAQGGAK